MESVRRQFETNVFGLIRMCQLVLPGMRSEGSGRIVNLSSMGGKLVFPGGGVYHATKHAVEALSDALRFEVRGFGVDVVIIEPGLIVTDFGETAAGSLAEVDEHGPYADFNARGREGDGQCVHRIDGALRGGAGGGGGEDLQGALGEPAEHPLQGDRLGQAHDGDAKADDRPDVGSDGPLAVPASQARAPDARREGLKRASDPQMIRPWRPLARPSVP